MEMEHELGYGNVVGKALPLEPLKVAPEKPGYKTTEFWMTVASYLVSLLVLFGYLGPEVKDVANQYISDAVTHVTALVTILVATWKYIDGRTKTKTPGPVTIVES